MSFLSILLLAVGLALDAAAVSAVYGAVLPSVRARQIALLAASFGLAHAGMPTLGWLVGDWVGEHVAAFDHWIAFLILSGLGVRMLWGARPGAPEVLVPDDPFRPRILALLVLATSIDTFAAGLSLPLVGAPVLLSAALIGVVTTILSVAGLLLGRRFGSALGRRFDVIGGALLLTLGAWLLVKHLSD